ncbi:MAG: SpoIIE family protein phosphatase [Desulfobacula sp.]|uniref:PP2C family protein-serine/threonine phosphatase n=1 Tax=Desulfobacula sp. TaxID=2593537 RepID=UPI0025C60C24|nr:SpoIIE family protein phosphatase [Desulfobacula sp.]MCD4722041.1 SpoIIE family protein phosphatase [Desulfobacula sp.]
MTASKINVSEITLTPYYVIGLAAITIGVLVVVILNFFTPLDSIQDRILGLDQVLTLEFVLKSFFPRLLLVLTLSYFAVIKTIGQMLKPISACLVLFKKGSTPKPEQIEAAQKRLLNLHFLFIPVNVFMWILIPGFIGLFTVLTGMIDHRTAIILSARASMVGLIASAIASQRIEAFSRKRLIPFFFPEGQLSKLKGTAKISISKRIILANRLGAVIPLTILLVTLLTLQWEVETCPVSAITYGRGIILFTFVLFICTLIFSRELNRLLSHNIVDPINDLVRVLRGVQKGRFDEKVQIMSNDEIGYAGDVVNEMTRGLQEKKIIQRSLDLAREIQQNLLPRQNPEIPGLDIAGTSIYCDETGGDYFDYLLPEDNQKDRIRIVLGDVSGHGISSALLMATSRALFRQRSSMPGNLAQVASDVNRHLCEDVKDSGNFITLFGIEMNTVKKCLKWVRAGHDPAMLYDSQKKDFIELKGEGIALGVDESWQYKENEISGISDRHIAVLYTDGIWEARNFNGERFGKEKLCRIIRENAHLSSQEILKSIIDALNQFLKEEKRQDDATLIIIKVCNISDGII